LDFGPDGHLYVSTRSNSDNVLRFNGVTGAFIDEFVATGSGGLNNPSATTFGPDGNLYVSNHGSANILRYDGVTGAFLDEFVPSGSGGLEISRGLTFDSAGDLYASNFSQTSVQDSVLKYDGVTGAFLGTFVEIGSGGLKAPKDLTFGPDGNLYVGSGGTDAVLRYDGATGEFIDEFVETGSGGLIAPTSGVFGPDGFFYVGGGQSNSLLRFNANDGTFVDHLVPSGEGGLDNPQEAAFGPDGSLYVANRLAGQIVRFSQGLTVSLSSAQVESVTVDFATSDTVPASAFAGIDYTPLSGTLTFAPGETTKKVFVTTMDDVIEEQDETFVVNLGNPSAGATIVDGIGVATITDNDSPFDPNTLYVYDIRFESKRGGKDYRAVFEIRSDSDADGQASADDDTAAGVFVTVEFAGVTYTGTTDSNGIFRTDWIRNLSSGDHYANAVDLVLAGFVWNPLDLDLEDDSDGDGKPDAILPI
jgi:streptogramin lyase